MLSLNNNNKNCVCAHYSFKWWTPIFWLCNSVQFGQTAWIIITIHFIWSNQWHWKLLASVKATICQRLVGEQNQLYNIYGRRLLNEQVKHRPNFPDSLDVRTFSRESFRTFFGIVSDLSYRMGQQTAAFSSIWSLTLSLKSNVFHVWKSKICNTQTVQQILN